MNPYVFLKKKYNISSSNSLNGGHYVTVSTINNILYENDVNTVRIVTKENVEQYVTIIGYKE